MKLKIVLVLLFMLVNTSTQAATLTLHCLLKNNTSHPFKEKTVPCDNNQTGDIVKVRGHRTCEEFMGSAIQVHIDYFHLDAFLWPEMGQGTAKTKANLCSDTSYPGGSVQWNKDEIYIQTLENNFYRIGKVGRFEKDVFIVKGMKDGKRCWHINGKGRCATPANSF